MRGWRASIREEPLIVVPEQSGLFLCAGNRKPNVCIGVRTTQASRRGSGRPQQIRNSIFIERLAAYAK
jgi:hypothetical protein